MILPPKCFNIHHSCSELCFQCCQFSAPVKCPQKTIERERARRMLSIPWFSASTHAVLALNCQRWEWTHLVLKRSFRFTHLQWKISQPPMLCHNDELRKATDQTFGILCRKANEKNCCHLDRISPQQKCPTFCSTDNEDTGTRHKTWTSNMPQKPQSKRSSTLLINHYWAWNTQVNEIPEDDQEKCWAVLDNHYFWWNFSLLLKPPAFILYWNSTPGVFSCVCTCSTIFSSPPIFVILSSKTGNCCQCFMYIFQSSLLL